MSEISQPRILFLNRSYWPDTEATGQLLTELCEGLSDRFEVHVLAGQPNASLEEDWSAVTERNGVNIHRLRHFSFPKRFTLLKALNFLTFAAAARLKINRLRPIPDVVVFETDPFLLPFVANALSRRHGTKMIGYLQDIYPDVAVALGKAKDSWLIRRLRAGLFGVYRKSEATVVLSSDMKDLVSQSDVDEDRIHVVNNWADEQRIQPIDTSASTFRGTFASAKEFVVMYSGNLGLTQNLDRLLKAAKEIAVSNSNIRFALVGRGAKKKELQYWVDHNQLKSVQFFDYQPKEMLFDSLGAANLHFVPLDERLYQCLMPSKIYGILAAGRPILTTAPENSELARLIKDNHIGFSVPNATSDQLAECIHDASKLPPAEMAEMGERARELAVTKFSQQHSIRQFSLVLDSVVARSSDD